MENVGGRQLRKVRRHDGANSRLQALIGTCQMILACLSSCTKGLSKLIKTAERVSFVSNVIFITVILVNLFISYFGTSVC